MLEMLLAGTQANLMDFEWVSAAVGSGAAPIPSHTSGDIICAFAVDGTTGAANTIASPSGWSALEATSSIELFGGRFFNVRSVYKTAASSSESISWDAHVDIVCYAVIRGGSSSPIINSLGFSLMWGGYERYPLDDATVLDGSAAVLWLGMLDLAGAELDYWDQSCVERAKENASGYTGFVVTRNSNYVSEDINFLNAGLGAEGVGVAVEVQSG